MHTVSVQTAVQKLPIFREPPVVVLNRCPRAAPLPAAPPLETKAPPHQRFRRRRGEKNRRE